MAKVLFNKSLTAAQIKALGTSKTAVEGKIYFATDGGIFIGQADGSVLESAIASYDPGITSVSAGNKGVSVATDNGAVTVGLNVDANDKILSIDTTNGLKSGISINYDSTSSKVQLIGKDGSTVISEFDASDFIKDGILHDEIVFTTDAQGAASVTFPKGGTHSYTGLTANTKYIGLEFTDGAKTPSYSYEALAVGELVDVYTAGNGIEVSNANVISAKVVAGNGLSVDGNGIAMAAVVASTGGTGGSNGAMTAAQAEKLAGIDEGAEVNEIETITVNGVAATVSNKAATVTIDADDIEYAAASGGASAVSVKGAIDDIYDMLTWE